MKRLNFQEAPDSDDPHQASPPACTELILVTRMRDQRRVGAALLPTVVEWRPVRRMVALTAH